MSALSRWRSHNHNQPMFFELNHLNLDKSTASGHMICTGNHPRWNLSWSCWMIRNYGRHLVPDINISNDHLILFCFLITGYVKHYLARGEILLISVDLWWRRHIKVSRKEKVCRSFADLWWPLQAIKQQLLYNDMNFVVDSFKQTYKNSTGPLVAVQQLLVTIF